MNPTQLLSGLSDEAIEAEMQRRQRRRDLDAEREACNPLRQSQAFIYCRVSTVHQQWGLGAQLDSCVGFCESNGLDLGAPIEVVKQEVEAIKLSIAGDAGKRRHYVADSGIRLFVDKGHSGGKNVTDRPAGKELFAILRRGDTLVVSCFTRLGRSTKTIFERLEYMYKRGIRLVVVSAGTMGGIDYGTPMGRMIYGVLAIFAQLTRDLARENIVAGQRQAIAAGEYHPTTPPRDFGRSHGLRVDPNLSAAKGRPVHVTAVYDHPGERLVIGYFCWWYFVEGKSWGEMQELYHFTPLGRKLKEVVKHKHGWGRLQFANDTMLRALADGLANEWFSLAAESMGKTVPPQSEWGRDPVTRKRKPWLKTNRRFTKG